MVRSYSTYNLEKDHTVKLSKLSDVAIFPKPVERQKVSICLQVFCDEIITALKTHPGVVNGDDAISFLNKFVKFWKIMNVKGLLADYGFVVLTEQLYLLMMIVV